MTERHAESRRSSGTFQVAGDPVSDSPSRLRYFANVIHSGLMEADDDNDEITLDPPPAQPILEDDLLKTRIDAVVASPALWNRLEIRLGDLLEEMADFDDSLDDDELQSLFTVTIIALGAMHPTVPREYDPDPFRMTAWYEEEIATGPADEKMAEYMDTLFAKTAQPKVASASSLMKRFRQVW